MHTCGCVSADGCPPTVRATKSPDGRCGTLCVDPWGAMATLGNSVSARFWKKSENWATWPQRDPVERKEHLTVPKAWAQQDEMPREISDTQGTLDFQNSTDCIRRDLARQETDMEMPLTVPAGPS